MNFFSQGREIGIRNIMHAVKWDNPKDLSGTAIFLASKASDFINDNFLLENKYAEE